MYRFEIQHAAMCSLDLADEPETMETNVFIMCFRERTEPGLPFALRYEAIMGSNQTMSSAKGTLGPQSEPLFAGLKKAHEYVKTSTKSLGIMGAILMLDDMADFTQVKVPPRNVLKTRIYMWDWRPNPVSSQKKFLAPSSFLFE